MLFANVFNFSLNMNDGEQHLISFKCKNPEDAASGVASGNMLPINCELNHPQWGEVGCNQQLWNS